MANILEGYRTGILNWYGFPISTGPLQGMNNKSKTLKRQSCGYRDIVYFTLTPHAFHSAKRGLIESDQPALFV